MKTSIMEHIKSVRLLYAFATTLLLLAALDVAVLALDIPSRPNLVLRNEGRSDFFNDYFFHQMRLTTDRPAVAYFGASVIQGFVNSRPEATMPYRVQEYLLDEGIPSRSFNLAVIGNSFGDHMALASESIRNGVDLLVIPLHFKLFSGQGTLNRMVVHKDNVFYLRSRADFKMLRRKILKVPDNEWGKIRIRKNLEFVWAFYRQRKLLSFWLTGETGPFPKALTTCLAKRIDALGPLIKTAYNPDQRNADNLWKDKSAIYHDSNRNTYSKIELSRDIIHFQTLELLCAMAADRKANLLFYLIPLNRKANAKFHYFDWKEHARLKEMIQEMAGEYGHGFVDLTDAADNRYFTDGDHLNMNGHDELARALTPSIAQALVSAP